VEGSFSHSEVIQYFLIDIFTVLLALFDPIKVFFLIYIFSPRLLRSYDMTLTQRNGSYLFSFQVPEPA